MAALNIFYRKNKDICLYESDVYRFTTQKITCDCNCIFCHVDYNDGKACISDGYAADQYSERARAVQERERSIKAKRGSIYDRNGVILADNEAVCSISVIHSQIEDPETVIQVLSEKLEIPEDDVRKRVEKVSVREKIKSNVDKTLADEIREMNLAGVMIDEDYKRYYPYDTLASHVLGFTGSDNQGIVGLEVYYDDLLMGEAEVSIP